MAPKKRKHIIKTASSSKRQKQSESDIKAGEKLLRERKKKQQNLGSKEKESKQLGLQIHQLESKDRVLSKQIYGLQNERDTIRREQREAEAEHEKINKQNRTARLSLAAQTISGKAASVCALSIFESNPTWLGTRDLHSIISGYLYDPVVSEIKTVDMTLSHANGKIIGEYPFYARGMQWSLTFDNFTTRSGVARRRVSAFLPVVTPRDPHEPSFVIICKFRLNGKANWDDSVPHLHPDRAYDVKDKVTGAIYRGKYRTHRDQKVFGGLGLGLTTQNLLSVTIDVEDSDVIESVLFLDVKDSDVSDEPDENESEDETELLSNSDDVAFIASDDDFIASDGE